MIITKDILVKGKSRNGSYSRAQLEALGESWPLLKGWYNRILYKDVPEESVKRFLDLKNAHLVSPALNKSEEELYKEFLRVTYGI